VETAFGPQTLVTMTTPVSEHATLDMKSHMLTAKLASVSQGFTSVTWLPNNVAVNLQIFHDKWPTLTGSYHQK